MDDREKIALLRSVLIACATSFRVVDELKNDNTYIAIIAAIDKALAETNNKEREV